MAKLKTADPSEVEAVQGADSQAPALLKLTRPEPAEEGGPTTADIPPEQMEEWLTAGWSIESDSNQKQGN